MSERKDSARPLSALNARAQARREALQRQGRVAVQRIIKEPDAPDPAEEADDKPVIDEPVDISK